MTLEEIELSQMHYAHFKELSTEVMDELFAMAKASLEEATVKVKKPK